MVPLIINPIYTLYSGHFPYDWWFFGSLKFGNFPPKMSKMNSQLWILDDFCSGWFLLTPPVLGHPLWSQSANLSKSLSPVTGDGSRDPRRAGGWQIGSGIFRKKIGIFQGIVGCTPGPTYPYGKSLYKPYITWLFMGYNPYCPLSLFIGLFNMGIILDRNHAKQQTPAWTFRFLALKWKPPAYSFFHCRAFGCRVAFANFSEAPIFSYFWSYFFPIFFLFFGSVLEPQNCQKPKNKEIAKNLEKIRKKIGKK